MPSTVQLQAWLAEAYVARHNLITGQMAVVRRFGERTVQYNATTANDLEEYIATLLQMISESEGGATRRRTYRVTQTGNGL